MPNPWLENPLFFILAKIGYHCGCHLLTGCHNGERVLLRLAFGPEDTSVRGCPTPTLFVSEWIAQKSKKSVKRN